MIEKWEDIPGYIGFYKVSNTGKVKSVDRIISDCKCRRMFVGKNLKQSIHNGKQPYFYVTLSKNGERKKMLVHQLVAKVFISNPDNLPQVNHKDGNVHNNNISNLEWVTNSQNTQHAYDKHLRKKNVIWVYDGVNIMPLRQVCILLSLNYKKVHYRLRYLKWDLQKAIEYKGGGKYVMCEIIPASV